MPAAVAATDCRCQMRTTRKPRARAFFFSAPNFGEARDGLQFTARFSKLPLKDFGKTAAGKNSLGAPESLWDTTGWAWWKSFST
jgi:hypothetical protein